MWSAAIFVLAAVVLTASLLLLVSAALDFSEWVAQRWEERREKKRAASVKPRTDK